MDPPSWSFEGIHLFDLDLDMRKSVPKYIDHHLVGEQFELVMNTDKVILMLGWSQTTHRCHCPPAVPPPSSPNRPLRKGQAEHCHEDEYEHGNMADCRRILARDTMDADCSGGTRLDRAVPQCQPLGD